MIIVNKIIFTVDGNCICAIFLIILHEMQPQVQQQML